MSISKKDAIRDLEELRQEAARGSGSSNGTATKVGDLIVQLRGGRISASQAVRTARDEVSGGQVVF